jgi:5-methylcytosine-specific restriction endonuclease McrA
LNKDSNFDWPRFHAYRVFEEFLKKFIIDRKSYVTHHIQQLNLKAAFEEISSCFVEGFDDSKKDFETKIKLQFKEASEESKIVFANIEFLWAMPMDNILAKTKHSYAKRWFNKNEVVNGEQHLFNYPHTIANPGPWYLRNKYWELNALLRVLSLVASDIEIVDITSAKKRIAELSYSSIYGGTAKEGRFAVNKVCGVHSALLHLAAPDSYESIISESHKQQIIKVFEHVISDRPEIECREQKIRLIRERLYEEYGDEGDRDYKYRWFFYLDRVKSLWIGKSGTSQQLISSIDDEVHREQLAQDHSEEEGKKEPTTGYRVYRSARLVAETKKRDNFTCRACQFTFRKQIVHVHHLNPLSERQSPKETTLKDLVTLCPNCHYLAHFWLRKNSKYKNLEDLLQKLKPTAD